MDIRASDGRTADTARRHRRRGAALASALVWAAVALADARAPAEEIQRTDEAEAVEIVLVDVASGLVEVEGLKGAYVVRIDRDTRIESAAGPASVDDLRAGTRVRIDARDPLSGTGDEVMADRIRIVGPS